MRYPRTILIFDSFKQSTDLEYFQSITSSSRKVYLQGISKPIATIQAELRILEELDMHLSQSAHSRAYLVVSDLRAVEFIATALADKHASIYWLQDKKTILQAKLGLSSLVGLQEMRFHLNDALYHYTDAREQYQSQIGFEHIPNDSFPSLLARIINGQYSVDLKECIENVIYKELNMNRYLPPPSSAL